MKSQFKFRCSILWGAFWIALAVVISCDPSPKPVTNDVVANDVVKTDDCPPPLKWLKKSPIPEPDYANFPCGYTVNAKGEVTNEAFHEISWQYFLWLTEEVEQGAEKVLRFETMYNDGSINPNNDPSVARTHILGGIQQAGSNGVLVDDNGRAIYTSMMISDIYHDFIEQNKLNTPDGLQNADPTLDFPDGSVSLKAAWKIIPEGQKPPKGAYTRASKLYTVVDIDGNLTTSDNYEDPNKVETIEETVALVGFHIAVVVKDHPEFIWASFEHNDNSPNFFLKNDTVPVGDTISDSNYTFYKARTVEPMCNIGNYGTLTVDPTTQKISGSYGVDPTTQVYRRYQYGGGKSSNQNNIERLNGIVHDSQPDNSLCQNYHEVGAVWFDLDNGSLHPDWSPTTDPNLETGSLTLSNSVIETFTQDPNQQDGCFSCHNTTRFMPDKEHEIKGKNVLTSHIILKNYMELVNRTAAQKPADRTK